MVTSLKTMIINPPARTRRGADTSQSIDVLLHKERHSSTGTMIPLKSQCAITQGETSIYRYDGSAQIPIFYHTRRYICRYDNTNQTPQCPITLGETFNHRHDDTGQIPMYDHTRRGIHVHNYMMI